MEGWKVAEQDKQRLKLVVAEVSTSKDVHDKVVSIVNQKLGAVVYGLGEVENIAQDALAEVTMKFLRIVERGTVKDSESLLIKFDKDKVKNHPMAYYLYTGVERYCDTRLRRWSNDNEQNQYGARARVVIDNRTEVESEFWDENVSHEFKEIAFDSDKLEALLRERLKDHEMRCIMLYLNGMTFEAMADADLDGDGGRADKYRKRFNRALEKADLQGLKAYV